VPLLAPCPAPRSPEVDTIWVIVPHSRPEHLKRLHDNFNRQRFPQKKLVVVYNGRALTEFGECAPMQGWAFSREHPSLAKNAGIDHIKKRGGGFFTVMDDDDWYGPGYLDELAGYARSYDALGKQRHFISLGEGIEDPAPSLLLANRRYADIESTTGFTGGTISGWTDTALPFLVIPAEDIDWCSRMRSLGMRMKGLSIYHYLYRRSYAGAQHTWAQSRERFRDKLLHRDTLEFPLTESGDIDIAIVTGEKAPGRYRVLGQERFIPTSQTHP
jgi:hypothetical protein